MSTYTLGIVQTEMRRHGFLRTSINSRPRSRFLNCPNALSLREACGSFFENILSPEQTLVQQELYDSHILDAVIVSPGLQEPLDDDHLLEGIRDAQQ